MQNADDAGARTVRIMLNTRQYGDGSLLGPAMGSWQGPSLYVYNDATFTDRDFQNVAKIGQVGMLFLNVGGSGLEGGGGKNINWGSGLTLSYLQRLEGIAGDLRDRASRMLY